MNWITEIGNITTWYYILIAVLLVVGFIGMWIHKTSLPMLWAGIMSLILFIGATTLEPLIFGYQYYALYSFQWFLVATFGLLFGFILIQYGYNILRYGSVVE